MVDSNKVIEVVAKSVDNIHIYYECPYCWTIQGGRCVGSAIKANGVGFYKSATPTLHKHGSGGNYQNRVEFRATHCNYSRGDSVQIHITDETKKPPIPVMMGKKSNKVNSNYTINFS